MIDLHPSLHRVGVTVLAIALAANVLLWHVSGIDDTFANIIAIASGAAAVALVVSAVAARAHRWREEAAIVAFAVWTANLIEFALEDVSTPWAQVRQCGMYAAFAVLALGVAVAQHVTNHVDHGAR